MWRFSVRWDVLGMILPLCDSLRRRRLQPDCKKWFTIYYLKPRPDPPQVEVLLSQMALLKSLRVHQPLHKDTKYLCTLCSLFSFSVLQVNIPPAKGQRLHCFSLYVSFFFAKLLSCHITRGFLETVAGVSHGTRSEEDHPLRINLNCQSICVTHFSQQKESLLSNSAAPHRCLCGRPQNGCLSAVCFFFSPKPIFPLVSQSVPERSSSCSWMAISEQLFHSNIGQHETLKMDFLSPFLILPL